MFTCPLVNLLLEPTLFLCYFVFNYPVYKQLVYSSTCYPVKKAPDASRTRGLESLLYNENLRFLERSRL